VSSVISSVTPNITSNFSAKSDLKQAHNKQD